MKVLYLIDNYSLGGAQTIVKGIMENNTNNPEVFSIALRKKLPDIEIHNSNAICIESKSKFSLFPVFFIRKFITQHNIEIVHCQLPRSILFGYILKRFFFPKIKWIIHEQGDIFESKLYAFLLRQIYKKSNCNIACSKATAEMMHNRSQIPMNQVGILYNFVDLHRFVSLKKDDLKVYNIGFAGRIEKRKGWHEFIIAANLLQQQNLKFHIAGTGSETTPMHNLIHELKLNNLVNHGFVKEPEKFYSEIDLLIVPSHFEPMGMVAVEAMACGVLVAASNVPGLNEVVKHDYNGWLLQSQSASAIADTIKRILLTDQDKLVKIQKNALLSVSEYSYKTFDLKMNKIYQILS